MYSDCYEGINFFIIPIRLRDPNSILKLISNNVQLLNANLIAGYEHILTSLKFAIRSWKKNKNIAKSLVMEVLLYASATRQIKDAINKIGINQNLKECIVLIINDKSIINELLKYGEEDESLIKITKEKIKKLMEAFNIKELEFSIAKSIYEKEEIAIQSLVLEKIALSELFR
ncbi:MAG: KEOPS complex subunit Cgi121 [Candidatus Methanomethylicaceae archaeon]|nr:KEOPS complex subunit Cgi121 [Candidatus Verstraetearchaeota archaeon]